MRDGGDDAIRQASVLHELQKRKQVERDAVRLRNRLLQLERQTEKADKRVALTKRRAKNILDQRERNEQRERDRQRYIDELQQEIQQHRDDISKCVTASDPQPACRDQICCVPPQHIAHFTRPVAQLCICSSRQRKRRACM